MRERERERVCVCARDTIARVICECKKKKLKGQKTDSGHVTRRDLL